jgi:hypothetical protein
MRSMLRRLMLPATAFPLLATNTVYPGCARFTVAVGWDWTATARGYTVLAGETGMSFNILAVGRPGMGEERTIEHAAARAAAEHAALTLMCVWSPTRLIHWARLAGVDPSQLVSDHAEQSCQWVRSVVAGLPPDVSVKFACRRGMAKRAVAAELRTGRFDELVVSARLLGPRFRAKLERQYPDLRIELVEPVHELATMPEPAPVEPAPV